MVNIYIYGGRVEENIKRRKRNRDWEGRKESVNEKRDMICLRYSNRITKTYRKT